MDEFHIDRVAGLVFDRLWLLVAGEACSGRGNSSDGGLSQVASCTVNIRARQYNAYTKIYFNGKNDRFFNLGGHGDIYDVCWPSNALIRSVFKVMLFRLKVDWRRKNETK
jgi:hypothetical protein